MLYFYCKTVSCFLFLLLSIVVKLLMPLWRIKYHILLSSFNRQLDLCCMCLLLGESSNLSKSQRRKLNSSDPSNTTLHDADNATEK